MLTYPGFSAITKEAYLALLVNAPDKDRYTKLATSESLSQIEGDIHSLTANGFDALVCIDRSTRSLYHLNSIINAKSSGNTFRTAGHSVCEQLLKEDSFDSNNSIRDHGTIALPSKSAIYYLDPSAENILKD